MEERRDVSRYPKLLPYYKVKGRITDALSGMSPLSERVHVDAARGRVCAETILSRCNVPAVATSAMDGYAIRSVETQKTSNSRPAIFNVTGAIYPGARPPRVRLRGVEAIYVGTGAPIPGGADAVVKIEEARSLGDRISVSTIVPRWKNVICIGEDVRTGTVVVERGQIVNAADVALLIAVGRYSLSVFRTPRIGIVSTGDELTPLSKKEEGKKVDNYSNLIAGYLADANALPVPLGVARDDSDEILRIIRRGVRDLDALITIGGSSVGARDFTSMALRRASNCVEVFHGIRLVPVRPAGLFVYEGKPVVVLPGHAVAATLSFFLVARPVVNLLSGLDFDSRATILKARLTKQVSNPRPIGALFLAKLTALNGNYEAAVLPWGSDRISSLAGANAFFELKPHQTLGREEEVGLTLLGAPEISRVSSGEAH